MLCTWDTALVYEDDYNCNNKGQYVSYILQSRDHMTLRAIRIISLDNIVSYVHSIFNVTSYTEYKAMSMVHYQNVQSGANFSFIFTNYAYSTTDFTNEGFASFYILSR